MIPMEEETGRKRSPLTHSAFKSISKINQSLTQSFESNSKPLKKVTFARETWKTALPRPVAPQQYSSPYIHTDFSSQFRTLTEVDDNTTLNFNSSIIEEPAFRTITTKP